MSEQSCTIFSSVFLIKTVTHPQNKLKTINKSAQSIFVFRRKFYIIYRDRKQSVQRKTLTMIFFNTKMINNLISAVTHRFYSVLFFYLLVLITLSPFKVHRDNGLYEKRSYLLAPYKDPLISDFATLYCHHKQSCVHNVSSIGQREIGLISIRY